MRRVPTTLEQRNGWTRRRVQVYDAAYQRKAAQVVKEWKATHGDVCPGYMVPAHPSHDLTADHLLPISLGGQMMGDLGVLCRGCNTRKGGRNRIGMTYSNSPKVGEGWGI